MVVEVHRAVKYFMGSRVLDGVDLSVKSGERIAVMGPNGAGKTTLIRAILGFYRLDEGSIRVHSYDPVKERVEVLKHVGFIPQLPPPIRLSIDELLMYVERSSGLSRKRLFAEAERMDLDIERDLKKPFFKLSGGMKQKLLIAIALSKESDLLVFDEPTANLDPKGREKFYDLLTGIKPTCATLFITHRYEEIEGLVNRKIYMDLGRITEDETI